MPPIQPEKPFDEWNEYKKTVQKSETAFTFFYHPREIWWCALGINIGVETDGKREHFERPILIMKKFNKDMFWGVPLTSNSRSGRYFCKVTHETGVSWAFLPQLRIFSSKRLIRKAGAVPEADFLRVSNELVQLIQERNPPVREGFSEAEATNVTIVSGSKGESSAPRSIGDIQPGDAIKNEVK